MPYTVKGRVNRGAYSRPYSGVGVEFYPLGVEPGHSGITLHESGYLAQNQEWNYPSVFSPFWRLYYNFEPGHCVMFGEQVVELLPDRIILIPDHCYFHCLGENPVPTFWLAFSFTKALHRDMTIPVQLSLRDTERCLIRDVKNLIAADETCEPTDPIFRNTLALLQVVLARPELGWRPPISEKLARSRTYIEANISGRLTNDILAKEAALSVAGFERAFKRYHGCTPGRFVIETRVREVCHLLMETRESIDVIAEKTGFPNCAYLSRVFKMIVGDSPANFRKGAQKIRRQ